MAGSPGNLAPVRDTNETWTTTCVFDIGGTGAHTKRLGKGILSVTRQNTGQFTANFTDVGGALIDLDVKIQSPAAAVPQIGKYVVDSFSASAKSAQFEVYSVTTTPVRIDPVSGYDVVITAKWLKTL